jgi:4'-phosphopantetheinyl transferase
VFQSLPKLDRHSVVVIQVNLATAPAAETMLDDDELRRARRFMFERDYRRFVTARTALRGYLGAWLGVSPQSVDIAYAAGGKPVLRDQESGLRFNISHAGDYALIAVASGREVGIDIEQVRDIDVTAVARTMFSEREQMALAATAHAHRLEAFYRGWTRKESFLKALGSGLDFPAARFDVSLAVDPPRVLLTCCAAPHELHRWTISTPSTPPDYVAAITVQGFDFNIQLCHQT